MTIVAKFPGTCRKCGQAIKAGQEINWEKGAGSEHVKCPAAAAKPAVTTTPTPAPTGIVKIFTSRSRGAIESGYTFKTKEGQILTAIHVASRWINQNEVDDQDDFRQGGDPFYEYRLTCRVATTEESAPIIEQEQADARKTEIANRRSALVRRIRTTANHDTTVSDCNVPSGEHLCQQKFDNYGHWDRFTVGTDVIWYVTSEYDAPVTGWRVPLDEALVAELRTLNADMQGGSL